MKSSKAYIRGAYGPGNLGDDILMLCCINILKQRYAEQDIAVGVDNPQVARSLLPKIQWLHIKQPVKAELVVLGGGGQFFSFVPPEKSTPSLGEKLAKLTRRISIQTDLVSTLQRLYVGARGGVDKIYFHKRLAAFCIGLGPFDGGGQQQARAVEVINRCDYVSVRDGTSQKHCQSFGKQDVKVYTDPSLLSHLWVDKEKIKIASQIDKPCLSLVLRDWPHDARGQAFTESLVRSADVLAARGERVRFVSLYKERDQHLIDRYNQHEWLCWDATEDSVEGFMEKFIGESEVIISSRAHGVLLPASLGYPTIAVEIENKLRKVHEMLPKGTLLVSQPDHEIIIQALSQFRQNKEQMVEHLKIEIADRAALVEKSVDDFLSWLDKR